MLFIMGSQMMLHFHPCWCIFGAYAIKVKYWHQIVTKMYVTLSQIIFVLFCCSLFVEISFVWPNVLMSSFGEIITQSFLFLDFTTKTLDVSDTLQYLAGRLQRTRISFAFSNCNGLVSEVTFTLFSTGADNESGLTLDCSFSFQQRERERLGRQTNSLKGQILAMGREAGPPPAPTYPTSALHHLHFFQYVPESRLNSPLHTPLGQVTKEFNLFWPAVKRCAAR